MPKSSVLSIGSQEGLSAGFTSDRFFGQTKPILQCTDDYNVGMMIRPSAAFTAGAAPAAIG
jgi:hypothetical protein